MPPVTPASEPITVVESLTSNTAPALVMCTALVVGKFEAGAKTTLSKPTV